MKPLSDAEVIKYCLNKTTEALFEGKKKQVIFEQFRNISLFNDTSTSRTELLTDDLLKQLSDDIKHAQCISLAVDESPDSTDQAQLCIFVRYFSKVKGEALHCHTREDIYEAIMQMVDERGTDIC